MREENYDRRSVESTDSQESLVVDPRAQLTPAQMVERKLVALLKSAPLPVSHLQATRRRLPR